MCLLGKQDNGSCETCGMGSYDNKVIYIAETMLQLLNICTIAEYEAIYKHFVNQFGNPNHLIVYHNSHLYNLQDKE